MFKDAVLKSSISMLLRDLLSIAPGIIKRLYIRVSNLKLSGGSKGEGVNVLLLSIEDEIVSLSRKIKEDTNLSFKEGLSIHKVQFRNSRDFYCLTDCR